MKALTHEYWTVYQRKIIYKALLPWIFYSVLSLIYFAEVEFFVSVETSGFAMIYPYIVLLLTLYQLRIEAYSFYCDPRSYCWSKETLYNCNDIF